MEEKTAALKIEREKTRLSLSRERPTTAQEFEQGGKKKGGDELKYGDRKKDSRSSKGDGKLLPGRESEGDAQDRTSQGFDCMTRKKRGKRMAEEEKNRGHWKKKIDTSEVSIIKNSQSDLK